jgi:alpha-N-acetylglucosaminidase
MARIAALLLCVAWVGALPALGAEARSPEAAVRGLLQRLVPAQADRFALEAIPAERGRDVWEVQASGGRVTLRGSTGVAMASGLNWYLENRCRCDVSWCGVNLRLPRRLPDVRPAVRRSTRYRARYMLNYCAFSYSLAWWDFAQWERLIDWMALHGINMPLAVTGQEAVWEALGSRLGLTRAEMDRFLVGPAYLPFGWMGCIDGWGGPLPAGWVASHAELQRRILERQRSFGMTPVLQGFTGHVPDALSRVMPGAKLQRLPSWAGFPGTTFIDPTDPAFRRVGKAFVEEQTRLFGTDHLYAADTFIEMSPPSSDPAFLAEMGRAVHGAMADADPAAVWVMQGWLFVNNPGFWQPAQARALLTSVPNDRMLVLDLFCETEPAWKKTQAFYGKPWAFCTIQTFGDTVSLHGGLRQIAANLREALAVGAAGDLQGIGHIMEGLGCNPVVHSFVTDMVWRDDVPEVDAWLHDYVIRRYGRDDPSAQRAWQGLLRTAYAASGPAGTLLAERPGLGRGQAALSSDLYEAGRNLLQASPRLAAVDTYRFDLVNVTRQIVAASALEPYSEMVAAYGAGDRAALARAAARLDGIALDLDELLGTRRELLLGRWLADARRWGASDADRRLLDWNARTQITLWGPPDSMLHGYAQKQWSGMMDGFCAARWRRFAEALDAALAAGKPFDAAAFEADIRRWEYRWTHGAEAYPAEPAGDPVAIAARLLATYRWRQPARDAVSLTTGKPATCSHSLAPFPASAANDGVTGNADSYWATDINVSPEAWWQVDLLRPSSVGRVVVVNYYGDARTYGFTVEGSLDGRTWRMLADRRDSTLQSTRQGITCTFAPVRTRYLRVNVTSCSANSGRHLVEVMAFAK